MAKLDPDLVQVLAEIEKSPFLHFWTFPVAEARVAAQEKSNLFNGPVPSGAIITDCEIPGSHGPIPVRLYRPAESPARKILPLLLYFHGGGFVVNSPQDYDVFSILLCLASDCLIASVDYRLAPEHPFPKGLEDAIIALKWAQKNAGEWGGDCKRIAVGGDSAGGNFAAVLAHLNRDNRGPDLSFQLLIYPPTDLDGDYPSRREFGRGYNLDWEGMEWFIRHYISNPEELWNPKVSPLRSENFSGLPSALVLTAGFDPLKDEGIAYARKLQQAGIPVQHEHLPSMIHGFLMMRSRIPQIVDQAIAVCGKALKKAFS